MALTKTILVSQEFCHTEGFSQGFMKTLWYLQFFGNPRHFRMVLRKTLGFSHGFTKAIGFAQVFMKTSVSCEHPSIYKMAFTRAFRNILEFSQKPRVLMKTFEFLKNVQGVFYANPRVFTLVLQKSYCLHRIFMTTQVFS